MFNPNEGDRVRRRMDFRKGFEGEDRDEIGVVLSRGKVTRLDGSVEDRVKVQWPDGSTLHSFLWHFEAA